MWRIKYRLRTLFLVQLLCAVLLVGTWAWPKQQPLPLAEDYVGYYRGWGLLWGPGFLGANYYRIEYHPTGAVDGVSAITIEKDPFHSVIGYYANGQLREEGACVIERGVVGVPVPDVNTVQWGKYYRPDGSVGSEVRNGSGVQTYWNSRGQKVWELELRGFRRVRLKKWDDRGNLILSKEYATHDDRSPVLN